MRFCRIPDLINRIYYRVNSGIITDSKISTHHIIVNSTWQTNNGYIKLITEFFSSSKSAIAPNADQRIDLKLFKLVVSYLATFFGPELFAAGSFQNSSTFLDDI